MKRKKEGREKAYASLWGEKQRTTGRGRGERGRLCRRVPSVTVKT